jgi:hypothetical protein
MGWMKVDEQIGRHPKHLKVEPAASWLWLCAIGYCRNALTDGFVTRDALSLLGRFKRPERLAIELVAAKLWRRDEERDGWWVNDYLAMNPSKVDVLELRAKDSARKRRTESDGIPDGIRKESERPSCIRAPEVSLSVSLPDAGVGLRGEPERGRTSPLIPRQHGDVAYPWRVPFPGRLLTEFAAKLGGNGELAEKRVLDWVRTVIDSFDPDAPIPDAGDSFAWWRRQSRSLFPVAVTPSKVQERTFRNASAAAIVKAEIEARR